MKRITLTLLITLCAKVFFAQETLTQSNLKVSFLNPGLEYEMKLFDQSTLALHVGIGIGGAYKNLKTAGDGFTYLISPFCDMQYRNYYNIVQRKKAGKNVKYNASNYFGLRLLVRGPDISSSFSRTTEYDYAFGPTWGFQRSFKRYYVLLDFGPYLYFDLNGNYGFLPMFQLNLGYNLSRRS